MFQSSEHDILVCIKQILDPETPATDFRINCETREAEPRSGNFVIDTFSENALETALQLRERAGAGKITALSYGAITAEEALRKALAMKADHAVLVVNEGNRHPDSLTTARVLAAAVRKLGQFDVIMLGREAGDWGAAQTGGLLAEELSMPYVGYGDSIERDHGKLRIKRQTDWGTEVVEAQPPVVVTVTNDRNNQPRIPKVRDTMMAHRHLLTKWTLADLALETAESHAGNGYTEVVELSIAQTEIRCDIVAGDTLDEKVTAFAARIARVLSAL